MTNEYKKIHKLMTLRARMFLYGIKIKDVADSLKIHPSYVSHILAGRKGKDLIPKIQEVIHERRRTGNHHI